MDPGLLKALLEEVQRGEMSVEAAVGALAALPFREVQGMAHVDHHRALRTGFPEVVLGLGKTPEQVAAIVEELARAGGDVLVTRATEAQAAAVRALFPEARHDVTARCLVLERRSFVDRGRGVVLVISAGTADVPVAEEAALVATLAGNRVERIYDVGVAGLHRLLAHVDRLRAAEVIIVCAGMEGALPSVVGGLVDRPVLAVPTSIGYGASFGGVAALLGMLSSCASGVGVVNIDNGFGAGMLASAINRVRA
jgi:NCAIR mutase (PurE)-related protein